MTPENLINELNRQTIARWLELAYKIADTLDKHHITPDDFEKALPFILSTNFKDKDTNDPTIHEYFENLYKSSVSCLKLGRLAQEEKNLAN